jgi:membrane protease YdiL (CAAX protease family)
MENPNSGWVFPSPEKLAALGYTQQANLRFIDEFAPSFNILSFIPILIICSQTGFLLIGFWRMRRLKRELGPDKTASKSLLFKLSVGIFAGVGIVLIGLAYDLLFRTLFGSQADISGIWNETKKFSPESKIFIIFAGVIIAPICEEVFFRGALFKSFKDNGYSAFGIFFSSLMFAAVHFDLYSFPIYLIFGITLAYAYLKTNSLTSSIIAHAINNAVAFYLLYA